VTTLGRTWQWCRSTKSPYPRYATSNFQSGDAPDNVNIEYMWFEDRGGGLAQLPDRFADHAVRRLLAVAS